MIINNFFTNKQIKDDFRKREGLIRARQIGAQHATADIMVFLDAHSEPNYNWLPPLIEPITLDYRYYLLIALGGGNRGEQHATGAFIVRSPAISLPHLKLK